MRLARRSPICSYAEAKLVFVEDEEQTDKVLEIAGELPHLRWIIYNDQRGMRKNTTPGCCDARS